MTRGRSYLIKHPIAAAVAVLATLGVVAGAILAATGDLLDTVALTGNSSCNVGIAFDGAYVMTIDDGACFGQQIGIHTPSTGALVATKTIKDGAGNEVDISVIDWDSSRSRLWGAYGDDVYLIDIGVPTVTGDATATFQFSHAVGGIALVDGLAWDASDDTLYLSPDVDLNVYQFSLGTGVNPPLGTLMNTVAPQNAGGVADGSVSGVAIGAGNSLYIGRNGFNEIRRVDKTTGAFISTFATTAGRVEDLVCDPVTYAPNEAILAKDAYNSLYEAFEVEVGTCPIPDRTPPVVACVETVNPHGNTVPPAGKTTLPGAKGGQNEDGYYELLAKDEIDPGENDPGPLEIFVGSTGPSNAVFGPYASGDKVKITEAPGAIPSAKKIGSANGQAGAILVHLILDGDAYAYAVDASGNYSERALCLVPPLPK